MAATGASRNSITKVTALVDWNSQIHAAAPPRGILEEEIAQRTLYYVGRCITDALHGLESHGRYDVTLRLYGGWHRGFEVTERRKALRTVAAKALPLATKPNVAIRPILEFGDRLISASPDRLHIRLNIHLADTYRKSLLDEKRLSEKMVDTAIAADLVDLAHSDPARWLVVLGEDDDLIPPLIVASDVRGPHSGKVAIVRRRLTTPFLKFDDLRISL